MKLVKVEVFASCELKPDFVSRSIMRKLFGWKRGGALMECWSHVGIIATFSNGEEKVYDATGVGIAKSDLSKLLEEHTLPRRIDVTGRVKFVNLDFVHGWLEGRCGVEYSWSQYILFFLPKWMKHTANLLSNGREKAICSEFVTDFCLETDVISKAVFENPDAVDPKQIIEALEVLTTVLPRGRGQ